MTDRLRRRLGLTAEIASFLFAGAAILAQLGDSGEPSPWVLAAVAVGVPVAIALNWVAARLRGGVE